MGLVQRGFSCFCLSLSLRANARSADEVGWECRAICAWEEEGPAWVDIANGVWEVSKIGG